MEREYVGIDFHRRRSVVVRVSAAGERLSVVRVDNDPVAAVSSACSGRDAGRLQVRGSARDRQIGACRAVVPDR
jgi:hypothetical protein